MAGTSFAGGALVATAEFGVALGLGVVEWDGQMAAAGDSAWLGLLTWVVFLFAGAVLGGTAVARRAVRTVPAWVPLARLMAALGASAGAAAAVPLFWLPARDLPAALDPDPQLRVAACAAAGIAVGLVLATAALTSAPIGVNIAATIASVWAFALASVAVSYAGKAEPGSPRLGMIDAPDVAARADLWFAPLLMIGVAGGFGFAVAAAGRWLQTPRLGIALSGFAGPAIVAAAYLVAGPGGVDGQRLVPYVSSLLAVTVGLLASAAVSGIHRSRRTTQRVEVVTPAIVPRPTPLAIEAAPVSAPARPRRISARQPKAITAAPHGSPGTESAPKRKSPKKKAQPTAAPPPRVLLNPEDEEDKRLRKSEREHIGWMETLVNTPPDPDLVPRRRN